MNTLITPKQAVTLAFADGEFVSEKCIAEADIAAAEQRYIVPVIGRELHSRLLEGVYPEFVSDFLAAPAALFARVLIQPSLDIRTGQSGTVAPKSPSYQPAGEAQLQRLHRSVYIKAHTLLCSAADHLSKHKAEFPEYDPDLNILNRCFIEGGLIQVY